MVAHRQAGCWRSSREFYIWQQAAGREWHWAWFELLKHQSLLPVTQFLQQGHTSNNATPYESMEAIFIQATIESVTILAGGWQVLE